MERKKREKRKRKKKRVEEISQEGGLVSHCHGDFTIGRGEYLVKEKKIRKGKKGRNVSQCLLLLLLPFAFYKELYSLRTFVCFFILLSSSFIGAY